MTKQAQTLWQSHGHQEPQPRHGSPADRGSADRYYGRPRDPHYFEGASYDSRRFTTAEMTPAQVAEYNKAFDEETDRKDWGESWN